MLKLILIRHGNSFFDKDKGEISFRIGIDEEVAKSTVIVIYLETVK